MGINDDDVAAVRAASDIVAIISQATQLRKQGAQWVGRCPFHADNSPSFSVNANTNVYYCFGCGVSGDVINYVMEREGLGFPEAVEYLAAKAHISLRYTDRQQGEGRKQRERLMEVMARAVEWYHQRLLTAPDAGAARSYLRGRGLDGDVVREWQLGWAPDSWDEATRALKLDEKTARETGLGRRNSRGRLQDHFRGRILFPIADDQGRPIGFGGRILPGGERPGNQGKYQNTTETPLYAKSRVLYGLDRAKKAIVTAATVVVCEGYTDVIGFHRAGVPLAVAACGTSLTEEHVKLLRRFGARRFVLAFDADSAGQAAADRFYRWERDHDLEVAVADLPPGQDPGDLAQSDPERLPALVETARPFLRFRLDRAFATADLSTPEGRARAAHQALDIVAEHPDVLVRDQYIVDVASRCRVEPARLREQFEQHLRDRAAERARSGGSRGGRSGPAPGGRPQGDARRRDRRPGPGGGTPHGPRGPARGTGPSGSPPGPPGPGGRPSSPGGRPSGPGGRPSGPGGRPSGPGAPASGGPASGRGGPASGGPVSGPGAPASGGRASGAGGPASGGRSGSGGQEGGGGPGRGAPGAPASGGSASGGPPAGVPGPGPAGAPTVPDGGLAGRGGGGGAGARPAAGAGPVPPEEGEAGVAWGEEGRAVPNEPMDVPPWGDEPAGPTSDVPARPATPGARGAGRSGAGTRPGGTGGGGGRGRPPGPVRQGWAPGGPGPGGRGDRRSGLTGPMVEVLRHAVHQPAAVAPWLDEGVFDDPRHLALYRLLVASDTTEAARAAAPPELVDLLNRLLVEAPVSESFEAVRLMLSQVIQRELRTLNADGAPDPRDVVRQTVLLRSMLKDLHGADAAAATDAAGRLLAWLRQRGGDGG